MTFHLLAPQTAFRFALHQGQLQQPAFVHGAFNGHGIKTWRGYIRPPGSPPTALLQSRKLQVSCGREPFQQLPALVILQPSIGSFPLQQLADSPRNLRHSQGGKLHRDLTHQPQFTGGERASAKGE